LNGDFPSPKFAESRAGDRRSARCGTDPCQQRYRIIRRCTRRLGVGVDGQRKADLGNGFFRNPIVAGDHPDPTILKDGDNYYMTFSSFYSYPALVIWHSTDLVNWSKIGPALHEISA
jgi:xylan 1,4-beta-xylosidase